MIVGAYATAPRPIESEGQFRDYVDQVLALPDVTGLEIPYQGSGSPWNGLEYLHATDPSHRHVLTTVPAIVAGSASVPGLGLASADDAARKAAVELVREAWEFVRQVNQGGGGSIAGVELHSAPRRPGSSVDALRTSLDEIAAWEWDGMRLMIEHCDAYTDRHDPAKGYLTLDDEIAAATERGLGVLLNWGRSAIECRSATTPRDHVAAAASAGVLDGVVFSGASDLDSDYGPAWGDFHVPIKDSASAVSAASAVATSLLTADEVARCLAAAPAGLRFVGVKVAPPQTASTAERVGLVAANLGIVTRAAAQARGAGSPGRG